LPYPLFDVRFTNPVGWAGSSATINKTGNVLQGGAHTEKTKRMAW